MEDAIKLYNEAAVNFKDREKDQREKFLFSWTNGNKESLDVLKKYGITLTRNSQAIVLVQEPEELNRALQLSLQMGFIDAYRENPRRLTQLVTNIVKRMAKCDALGVSYKSEDGKFLNFIFSAREFNQKMTELGMDKETVLNEEVVENESSEKMMEVKETALRVLEQFAITEQKDAIFARLDEISGSGLSTKEMLMEAFKICAGNTELLSDAIDEVLGSMEKQSVGR